MARAQDTSPTAFLHRLVPPADIQAAAVQVGFVKRRRKIDPVAFLVATVLSVCGRGEESLAAMRRSLAARAGILVVRSAFWDRWTPAFEALVAWLLGRLQAASATSPPEYTGLLRGFKDVIAQDSTVMKVDSRLKKLWPGTRKSSSPAAIKAHTRVRVLTGELLWHRITGERHADSHAFGIGHWAKDILFLFDRGYASASLWWRIHRVGGYFLTRLPNSYRPEVVAVNRKHRGRARKLEGQSLRDAEKGLKRRLLDIQCRFRVKVRPYGKEKGRRFDHPFRVVGVWNPKTKEYHYYVTNIPADRIPAEQLADIYRLRWEVETFYKTAKGGLGLGEMDTSKPHIVRTLVRAALIRATLAMRAKCLAERNAPEGRWINPQQWVRVWRELLVHLCATALRALRLAVNFSWRHLALLALDPNVKRIPTRRRYGQALPDAS